MGARSRRAGVLWLVSLLVAVGLVAAGGSAALAEGTGNPAIDEAVGSDQHFLGFTGPFVVDFSNAPYATYYYSVSAAPSAEDPSFVWEAGKPATQSFAVAPLSGGDYTFSIDDLAGHTDSQEFTVRPRPQPYCSLVVPSVVRVNGPEEKIFGRLAGNCAAAKIDYASWDVRHLTRGFVNLFTFNGTGQDSWKYNSTNPLGTYAAVPTTAINQFADDVVQNSPRTTIRLASRLALTSERHRRLVTLRAVLTKYQPKALGFRAWSGRVVTISYRTCKACAWHRLGVRRTTGKGVIRYRVRAAHARYYRATAAGTTVVWAPYADQVRR
jgi:hypothetical protein